jgi:hypothetical protein
LKTGCKNVSQKSEKKSCQKVVKKSSKVVKSCQKIGKKLVTISEMTRRRRRRTRRSRRRFAVPRPGTTFFSMFEKCSRSAQEMLEKFSIIAPLL